MATRKQSTFERLTRRPLNRKQRKELERKLASEDPALDIVNRNVAGIDVGNESHFVAVAPGCDPQPIREFGSWTADLERMADWLQACGVESVVMQSTGVYWIALYDILEGRKFKICLTNARHTKNLPGRKSDVQESQWLLKLHTYGLLRDSFHPTEDIRALRSLWRLRDRHVKEAGRAVQHMQKAMTAMNVQLSNTISDISGATGQAIIRAIVNGERNPWKLVKFRDQRIRATEEEIARSLEGNWRDDMLFELKQAVSAYDFYQNQIAECDQRLQILLANLPQSQVKRAEAQTEVAAPVKQKRKRPRPDGNMPQFNLHAELERICGMDLTSIDGIDVMTAQTIVAELGTDFTHWKSEAHFTSWLGLTPSREVSGGKVVKQESRKVKNRVAAALRMSASSLIRSESYLGARYRSLRARLGAPKAIKAMARYLACLVYRMFTNGRSWVDQGAQEFERKRSERDLLFLKRKASALGYQLVTQPRCV
jgi:transposase